mgnify:FL=1
MFKSKWYNVLLILAIFMIIILWFKKQDLSPYYEGFSQDTPYLFVEGENIFDDFCKFMYNLD